jgi:hypothetical protein
MNQRLEDHHIKNWAVYQTHDERYMVAICPTCHDAIHHGILRVDDETIYAWKRLKRYPVQHDELTVEPGKLPSLCLGKHIARSPSGRLLVYDLSPANRLMYYTDRLDFYLINCTVSSAGGRTLIEIEDNRIKYNNQQYVCYERRPGRFRLTASRTEEFFPNWLEEKLKEQQSRFPSLDAERKDRVTLLDMEVVAPSQVRALLTCVDGVKAIVVESDTFYVCTTETVYSVSGQGQFIMPDDKKPLIGGGIWGFAEKETQ